MEFELPVQHQEMTPKKNTFVQPQNAMRYESAPNSSLEFKILIMALIIESTNKYSF